MAALGTPAQPVQARGYSIDTIAQITGISRMDAIEVREAPAMGAPEIGSVEGNTWVWVERCVSLQTASDWCLVERADLRGWVDARYLTPRWE